MLQEGVFNGVVSVKMDGHLSELTPSNMKKWRKKFQFFKPDERACQNDNGRFTLHSSHPQEHVPVPVPVNDDPIKHASVELKSDPPDDPGLRGLCLCTFIFPPTAR